MSSQQTASESLGHTVWKFQNFSATQILREINSRSSKTPILVVSEDLNFDFGQFQPTKIAKKS